MASITFTLNDQTQTVDADPNMPLLWVLRDLLGLTGTKYGCGIGVCGICTVLVEGQAVRACLQPVSEIAGKRLVTIEGLSPDRSHPVQKAWLAENVAQCGYCQAGQIMNAVALLLQNPRPTDEDIDARMSDVLCRCGTYQRIRKAIHRAAEEV